jgi:precorrin-6A/cobalt-precorrin-6A reductase
VRIGGYGSTPALRAFLKDEGFEMVIDATHPFAEKMSGSIIAATTDLNLPLIRVCRPAWEQPAGANWVEVAHLGHAMKIVPRRTNMLVTLGTSVTDDLFPFVKTNLVVRMIERPKHALPKRVQLIIARPPFTLEGELALMQEHGITHLLTKNSGGDQTRAKIDAAAQLELTTYIIPRPELGAAREVATVDEAVRLVQDAAS